MTTPTLVPVANIGSLIGAAVASAAIVDLGAISGAITFPDGQIPDGTLFTLEPAGALTLDLADLPWPSAEGTWGTIFIEIKQPATGSTFYGLTLSNSLGAPHQWQTSYGTAGTIPTVTLTDAVSGKDDLSIELRYTAAGTRYAILGPKFAALAGA